MSYFKRILQEVQEDPNNSSTTNLDAGNSYTFTGTGTSTLGVAGLQWNLKTDQNAIVYIEQSDDNTNWDVSDSFIYYHSKGGMGGTVQAITSYWRIRVVLIDSTATTYFRLKGILCPIASPLPRSLDSYERLVTSSSLEDAETNKRANVDSLGSLKSVTPVRLAGTTFSGNTKDTNFWTETVTGSGTVTQAGEITLSTGTTADSTAKYESVEKARKVTGTANQFRTVARNITLPAADCIRRIGPYDSDEGFFIEFDGETFSVVSRKSGVDTLVTNGNFNGNMGETIEILDTNFTRIIIEYTSLSAKFFINGILIHTIRSTTTSLTNNLNLKVTMEIINENGNIVDNQYEILFATILRLGELDTESKYEFIGTDTTTILKYGAGRLRRIVNLDNAGDVTVYDNTAATGTQIAVIDTAKALGDLTFEAPFSDGLTVVTSGGAKITVIYE